MLDLKNISKTFNPGTVNEGCPLENVNPHLDDGDFATIVGSNGARASPSRCSTPLRASSSPTPARSRWTAGDITFLPDFKRSKAIGRMFSGPAAALSPRT